VRGDGVEASATVPTAVIAPTTIVATVAIDTLDRIRTDMIETVPSTPDGSW
jgi:hypothetical protein